MWAALDSVLAGLGTTTCTIVHHHGVAAYRGHRYTLAMHDPAYLELGVALRDRRRELGLRQVELAELAGCSTRMVHAIEAGKPTVRLDKLVAVLEAVGLRLELGRGRGGLVTG